MNFKPKTAALLENERIIKHSEMTIEERAFVLEHIKARKPKTILEIGIAAGANSAAILQLLDDENMADSTLISVDYSNAYYRDLANPKTSANPRQSGFLVDELVSECKDNWRLYTGGTFAKCADKIASNDIMGGGG